MLLFDEKELFLQGNRPLQNLELPEAELLLMDALFDKTDSDRFFDIFLNRTPWREYQLEVYDKVHTAPRMICQYGNGSDAANSSLLPWTPELLEIKTKVEALTQHRFDRVLLNLYRDGNDGVSWHSDHEELSGAQPVIASVTFGQARPFRLRHKFRKEIPMTEIPLYHGTLLVMSGKTNSHWQHQIPKTKKDLLPRINLTFRQTKTECPGS